MLKDLIRKSRTYRRFEESRQISRKQLMELVDLARLSPSGGNRQPLKYYFSYEMDKNELIFKTLSWARYLKEWNGPVKGERPSAYIIILGDNSISESFGAGFGVDPGVAAQSILLGAVEKGFGGSINASIKKELLRASLEIPYQYEILYVLALGYPIEKIKIEKVNQSGNIEYWRDENQAHHVPKRSLSEIIIN